MAKKKKQASNGDADKNLDQIALLHIISLQKGALTT